ncbi:hypothetical protein NLG97_g7192 [Lecanicillium saksenae]|uniref:Uncharacterized protein n=1 Tax=Lecanicillium saksenae TaxID=468837 RepID=A0ACC1QP66_9HYPO|nr:hypothetical protein NLG97_g7192 [Lecanicillium saksenae]
MKCAAIISIGLVAITSASIGAEDRKRDAAPYKKVIDSITSAVDTLDDAVKKYSGEKKSKTIDGLDELQASDAGPLSGSLRSLNTKGETLTDDLKAKRGDVEKAGECDSVREAIQDINKSAQALVNSAVSKVPKGLQSIAQGFVNQFTSSFNTTQDYFSTSNCKNGNSGGGGGSSSAGSSVSSTGSGSSASSTGSAASGSSTTAPSKTSSQTAASPSGSSGASVFSPAWTLGTAMALFAVYY